MKKGIPIGISDFKELIESNYYFIDKSLFIKTFLEDNAKVILIPRPRRFGKTLNLSMLKYFFQIAKEDNRHLFKGLDIENEKQLMKLQGQYPVIYISFKDEKHLNWDNCSESLKILVSRLYRDFDYLIQAEKLSEFERLQFKKIMNMELPFIYYEKALHDLSEYLYKYHNKKVIILIDEYDIPIQEGYFNNYYDNVINFMRNFLSSAFKDNPYLEKGLLTGILRVAKESIFSGLNNLDVSTLLSKRFRKSFGFLEDELLDFLNYYDIKDSCADLKNWYNGYVFGGNTIYNPWSILNYIRNYPNPFEAYWVNTSSNNLIKNILKKGDAHLKRELELLVDGGIITKAINENIVFGEIEDNNENIWSFLLFSGYLKTVKSEVINARRICDLKIPNEEVKYLYEDIILNWFKESIGHINLSNMIDYLLKGDTITFGKMFIDTVESSLSYFDVSGESEKFYHAFVLGMLVELKDDYQVKSNRESGYGRYDVMIIPKDKKLKGVIIEFKKVDKFENETLEMALDNALNQIEEKNYERELVDRGVNDIVKLAIAFEGKRVGVKRFIS